VDAVESRSIPELVSSLTSDLANLVRKESELVRTEVKENIAQTAKAAVLIAVGAALLLGAFLVLLQALVLALSTVTGPVWASIIVGVVVGAAGALLIRGAAAKMTPAALAPDRAARQLHKDAQLMKGQAQ
jgi:VIT1/CCC1 family predicted Fe2+/Mn2+ transporter